MGEIFILVEGDGEKTAAPALLRRILYEHYARYEFSPRAINVGGRFNLLKKLGVETFAERVRRNSECEGMLVLLDLEDWNQDCPVYLAYSLVSRLTALQLPFPSAIVVASCEYESWFLASLGTLSGTCDLHDNLEFKDDPEHKCNSKEWLNAHMTTKYRETIHQVKMTSHLDLNTVAEKMRSFRRLLHAVEELLTAIDQKKAIVTPVIPT